MSAASDSAKNTLDSERTQERDELLARLGRHRKESALRRLCAYDPHATRSAFSNFSGCSMWGTCAAPSTVNSGQRWRAAADTAMWKGTIRSSRPQTSAVGTAMRASSSLGISLARLLNNCPIVVFTLVDRLSG